jgi:hypothetical protein
MNHPEWRMAVRPEEALPPFSEILITSAHWTFSKSYGELSKSCANADCQEREYSLSQGYLVIFHCLLFYLFYFCEIEF